MLPARHTRVPRADERQTVTGNPKSRAGKRTIYLPDFLLPELRRHLQWFAEKEPDGLPFVAAILLPDRELSSVRFAVGAVSFLCTALGVIVLANGLTLSGILDGRAQPPRVRQDFGRGISF